MLIDNLQIEAKNNFYNYKDASINSDEIGLYLKSFISKFALISPVFP